MKYNVLYRSTLADPSLYITFSTYIGLSLDSYKVRVVFLFLVQCVVMFHHLFHAVLSLYFFNCLYSLFFFFFFLVNVAYIYIYFLIYRKASSCWAIILVTLITFLIAVVEAEREFFFTPLWPALLAAVLLPL